MGAGGTPTTRNDEMGAGGTPTTRNDEMGAGGTPTTRNDEMGAGGTPTTRNDEMGAGGTPTTRNDEMGAGGTPTTRCNEMRVGGTPTTRCEKKVKSVFVFLTLVSGWILILIVLLIICSYLLFPKACFPLPSLLVYFYFTFCCISYNCTGLFGSLVLASSLLRRG